MELWSVFAAGGLLGISGGGVKARPATKDTVLQRKKNLGARTNDALFLGEGGCYCQVFASVGLHFTFVSRRSEVGSWGEFAKQSNLASVKNLRFGVAVFWCCHRNIHSFARHSLVIVRNIAETAESSVSIGLRIFSSAS